MRRREVFGERMLLHSGCEFFRLRPLVLIPLQDNETERLLRTYCVHFCIMGLVVCQSYTIGIGFAMY
jgi:hypothetical protein